MPVRVSDSEGDMHKLLSVVLLLLPVSLFSAPELWVGGSFLADRNYVSDDISSSFPAMGDDVTQIRSLGLDLDIVFFPDSRVRVGFIGGYNLLLPIGYAESGGNNEGYITYDFDYRQDLSIGAAWYQFFSPGIGAFIACSFEHSWYRTAMEHVPNDNEPMEYIREREYGILGEAGIITRSGDSYFRLGVSGYYDLSHRAHGFRLALSAGGGFIIGG